MPQFAVADTSSAAASLLNGLNAAANQQVTQQRLQANATAAQAQQGIKDEFQALNDGWIPVAGPSDSGAQPGYVTKDPGAAPNTPGNTMPVLKGEPSHYQTDAPAPGDMSNKADGSGFYDPPAQPSPPSGRDVNRMKQINGNWYYAPTASEKEQSGLNDTNSFVAAPGSDTEKFLQQTANIPPGTRVPFSHEQAIDSLATQLRASADAADKRKQVATVNQEASDKAKAIGIDLRVGSEVPIGQLNEVIQALQPKEKAPKPDTHVVVPGYQGPNGGLLTRDTTSNTVSEVPLPPGSKAVLTADQQDRSNDRKVTQARIAEDQATRLSAGDQKKADDKAKVQQKVQDKHDDFRSQEKDQWNLKGFYDKLIDPSQTPDNTTVTLPNYNAKTGEINEGSTRTMNPDLRGSLTRLSKQAADKAMENQDSARKIRKSMGWGEFAKPAQTASPAPSQPAPQRTAAPAAPAGAAKQTFAVNPKTNERLVLKGGQWIPAQ